MYGEFPETTVCPSGEEEKKEKTLVSSFKALPRFSSLYVRMPFTQKYFFSYDYNYIIAHCKETN